MEIYVVISIIVIIIMYLLITYNSFVKLKNRVKEAFSTMDVYLKKRWDLIPNIVETVKGYTEHERNTFEKVVELRNSTYDNMTSNDKIRVNEQLSAGISKLMMLSENYPNLKASENFLDLSNKLSKLEEDIANARKYYNAVVKNFNNKTEMFPSNIIANLFGYKTIKMFEIVELERENVKVKI